MTSSLHRFLPSATIFDTPQSLSQSSNVVVARGKLILVVIVIKKTHVFSIPTVFGSISKCIKEVSVKLLGSSCAC
jgi:hypothetical protein